MKSRLRGECHTPYQEKRRENSAFIKEALDGRAKRRTLDGGKNLLVGKSTKRSLGKKGGGH